MHPVYSQQDRLVEWGNLVEVLEGLASGKRGKKMPTAQAMGIQTVMSDLNEG